LVEITIRALERKQGKPWIVCGGEAVGPCVCGVQLPVEQAEQTVGESFLTRFNTVPDDGNPRENVSIFERTAIEPAAATHSRSQRLHLNEISYRAHTFHGFGHVRINRMIGGEDRCTVLNAEHSELDMVCAGLSDAGGARNNLAMSVELEFMWHVAVFCWLSRRCFTILPSLLGSFARSASYDPQ
jgi:hypothetical protein